MAIPNRKKVMSPLLQHVADGKEHKVSDIVKALVSDFSLDEEQRNRKVPSGNKVFNNSCHDAIELLKKEGMLESTRRGHYKITTLGREELENPSSPRDSEETKTVGHGVGEAVEKSIEKNYQQIRSELAEELLQRIGENTPDFFEELVIDLLVNMGYGGSRRDAEAVGRSGDGGIDGVINEDRLGLDVIYVQAKRWGQNVGAQPVRDFIGALQIQRARKGIFITTSRFSESAKECVSEAESKDCKVVLIDGHQLAEYMIDYNVGVSTLKSYEIKRVDSDYFIETDDSQTQDS